MQRGRASLALLQQVALATRPLPMVHGWRYGGDVAREDIRRSGCDIFQITCGLPRPSVAVVCRYRLSLSLSQ
jgi:hypothetical protein